MEVGAGELVVLRRRPLGDDEAEDGDDEGEDESAMSSSLDINPSAVDSFSGGFEGLGLR